MLRAVSLLAFLLLACRPEVIYVDKPEIVYVEKPVPIEVEKIVEVEVVREVPVETIVEVEVTPTPTPIQKTLPTPTNTPTPTRTPIPEVTPTPTPIQKTLPTPTNTPTPTRTPIPEVTPASTGSVDLSKVKTPSDVERVFSTVIQILIDAGLAPKSGFSYECRHKKNVGGMELYSWCSSTGGETVMASALYSVFTWKVVSLVRTVEISSGVPIVSECFFDTGEKVSDCGTESVSETEALRMMLELGEFWRVFEE